jgi:hypothetical protein
MEVCQSMQRRPFARVVIAVALLAIAVLCSYRLRSYADPALTGQWGVRVIVGLIGSACLLGLVMLFLPRKPDDQESSAPSVRNER